MDIPTIMASVAGAVGSKIVFHPLDTLRTLQQTSTNFSYSLPIHRYWSGLGASVVLTTPAFTTYMVTYRQTKRELTPYLGDSSITNYVISGAAAEIASSFIWTPMEVVKGRMQIASTEIGTFELIRQIRQSEGVKGFFRGYWMGIVVFLPHSIVWWTTYEEAKRLLAENRILQSPISLATQQKQSQQQHLSVGDITNIDGVLPANLAELTPTHYAIASAGATVVAQTSTNFLDVVKTRQQLAVSKEIAHLRPDDQLGVFTVARNLVKEVGFFRACFKGLHVRLLQSLPSSILSMVIVETLNPDISTKAVMKQAFEEEEQVM